MCRISGKEADKDDSLENYSKLGRKNGGTLNDSTALVRIPIKSQLALQDMPKTRRVSAIADELVALWQFVNPVISGQQVWKRHKGNFAKGKEGACARKRIAAVPISVPLAIGLQAVGIHTHVPRLANVSPEQ